MPYEYPVAFTRGLLAPANPLLAETLARRETDKRHRCLVFIDAGLAAARPDLAGMVEAYARAHSTRMVLAAAPVVVPGGEIVKTDPAHVEAIRGAIHAHGIDRHAYVIAIGGGAVLDAVGLAAATAHRGVRHVRVPSTVLGQNDSGVGVKNAVNLHGVKNYTGTFAPPWAVLNDLGLLDALPRRERRAGIAEAVKVALIRDGAFFRWLEDNVGALARFEPAAEAWMIERSATLHMRQIAHGGDPFENGSARPLDFGHWSAHKLESLTRHRIGHGEAVAIGIALDARYSVLAGLLEPGADERVAALLEGLGLRVHHPALGRRGPDGRLAVLAGLEEFREHLGGDLTVTMLAGLGGGVEVHEIDAGLMAEAIRWLAARDAGSTPPERDPAALTYCLNVHAGEDWAALRRALSGPARAVKAAVSPDTPFPLGLRVSAAALGELAEPAARAEMRALLDPASFKAVSVNGFPYGAFHGTAVKERVYQPDWLSGARLDYTRALADLMADLARPGETVSLSTVPGTFRPLGLGREAEMAATLVDAAAHCARLAERTGVTVAIAVEPEPACFLETTEEAVRFFEDHLFSSASVARMAASTGLARGAAAEALHRHLGLCYDVCHAAVEFEDAAGGIAALRRAGIGVPKLQLSSALRVPSVDAEAREALRAFAEPVYLHQVVSRRGDGPLRRETDLPAALARGAAADSEEWRVHFHVPVFVAEAGPFATTQDFLAEILALHRADPISPHLEIETYTWDVLPPALRASSLEASIAREIRWVAERLAP